MLLRKMFESRENELRPHEVEPLFLILTCLTNLKTFCRNVKGQSVKKGQNEDKVKQKRAQKMPAGGSEV